jgi:thioredoxin-like negative regulator of GroEL
VQAVALAADRIRLGEAEVMIAADSNDLDARLKLVNVLIASNRVTGGMDQLLEIVQRELVSTYRRKQASALN